MGHFQEEEERRSPLLLVVAAPARTFGRTRCVTDAAAVLRPRHGSRSSEIRQRTRTTKRFLAGEKAYREDIKKDNCSKQRAFQLQVNNDSVQHLSNAGKTVRDIQKVLHEKVYSAKKRECWTQQQNLSCLRRLQHQHIHSQHCLHGSKRGGPRCEICIWTATPARCICGPS